jgi:IS30 family transposase
MQKRKGDANEEERRGQISSRRPFSARPTHIQGRQKVDHWEGDSVIGANHTQAIVTVMERKSRCGAMVKLSNKTADLVGRPSSKRSSRFKLDSTC